MEISRFIHLPTIKVDIKKSNDTQLLVVPTYKPIGLNNSITVLAPTSLLKTIEIESTFPFDMTMFISSHYIKEKFVNKIIHAIIHGLGISSSIVASYWGVAGPSKGMGKLLFNYPTLMDIYMYKDDLPLLDIFWKPLHNICINSTRIVDFEASYLFLNGLNVLDMRLISRNLYTVFEQPLFIFEEDEYQGFKSGLSFQHLKTGIMKPFSQQLTKNDSAFYVLCAMGYDIVHMNCPSAKFTKINETCVHTISLKEVSGKQIVVVDNGDPRATFFCVIFSLLLLLICFSLYCLFKIHLYQKNEIKMKRNQSVNMI